jgi:hypothetical protein
MRFLLPWIGLLLLILAEFAGAEPAPRTLAVAEFSTIGTDAPLWADRWSDRLVTQLARRAGPSLRLLPTAAVRAEARRLGARPEELYVWTGRAATLARAVGADWILTGRWTHLDVEAIQRPVDPQAPPVLVAFAQAVLQVRVVEAATQRILLEETFAATRAGGPTVGLLNQAVDDVLAQVARKILTLLP